MVFLLETVKRDKQDTTMIEVYLLFRAVQKDGMASCKGCKDWVPINANLGVCVRV